MKQYTVLIVILALSPFILWQIIGLLPTFDDWSYFTNPYHDFGEGLSSLVIPRDSYWRPFDCIFGHVLSFDKSLFPALNHIMVFLGHLINTFLVWHIARRVGLASQAVNVSTIFFFLSPAVLGTVLGIDSLNQTYSHLWGMMAIAAYLSSRRGRHLWLLFALIATMCKENGMVFFVVPQLMALAFGKASPRRAALDTLYPVLIIIAYFTMRMLMQTDVAEINAEYLENPVFRIVKNITKFFAATFVVTDYSLLAYKPMRNYPMAVFIALWLVPFYIFILWQGRKAIKTRTFLVLLFTIVTAASSHLVTLFTSMHSYAALGIVSIALGYLYQMVAERRRKAAVVLFSLFVVGAVVVDWHHVELSRQSGETGRQMALSVLKRITPCDSISVLYIDLDEDKYSSFCVIPYDAFGWGAAIRHYGSNGRPRFIDNEIFMPSDSVAISHYADSIVREGFRQVLLVKGDSIDIIRP